MITDIITDIKIDKDTEQVHFTFERRPITPECVYIWYDDTTFIGVNYNTLKDYIVFSPYTGKYVIIGKTNPFELLVYGSRSWPYQGIDYVYESRDIMANFSGKETKAPTHTKYYFAREFPYTFGLEYETACGYIPQEKLYTAGLVPLRDGSITGVEYASVVMKGNEGLNKIKEQCSLLEKYTKFNKECSLHIHFGGYPVTPEKIMALYVVMYFVQSELKYYLPRKSFETRDWKASGKDYCKSLPEMYGFNDLYEYFVGSPFFGSLTQPHPSDVERNRKWQVKGRYFWVNFINLLCYKGPKTLELRVLRPTYNHKKIIAFIRLFNALLTVADKYSSILVDKDTLSVKGSDEYFCLDYFLSLYSNKRVWNQIQQDLRKLSLIKNNQEACKDFIGERNEFDCIFE
jgi:hypothetical protein